MFCWCEWGVSFLKTGFHFRRSRSLSRSRKSASDLVKIENRSRKRRVAVVIEGLYASWSKHLSCIIYVFKKSNGSLLNWNVISKEIIIHSWQLNIICILRLTVDIIILFFWYALIDCICYYRDTLKRVLNLPQNTIMEYKAHQSSLK